MAKRFHPATLLLTLGVALYAVVFTAAAWYKYDHLLMGFDLGVHEQVIWNTAHGRIAATSAFAGTDSYLGIDLIPTELLLAPIYALAPSVYTLLLIKTLVLALGAVPAFLLVRARFGTPWAGLVFAATYLLYHPVQYMNLYEFQIRAFATTLLLWAWYFQERHRFGLFLLCALAALGCRSDVGIVLAGMGMAWLLGYRKIEAQADRRATFLFGMLPILLGLGWVVLATQVLVPWFRGGNEFLYTQIIYGWLGNSPGEMLRTMFTNPGYVLATINTPDRWSYLVQMLLPFGFLMVLQPRLLLITLPIFAINLLSSSPNIHASTRYHYQALIIPFLLIGAAYGLHWLLQHIARRWPTQVDVHRTRALLGVFCLALACNIVFRNPLMSLLGREIDMQKVAAVQTLLAQVPPEAALTTTSTIGPHASRRERLYFFPGNVIYPQAKVTLGEYLLIDDDEARIEGQQLLTIFEQNGTYRKLAELEGVSLWEKTAVKK